MTKNNDAFKNIFAGSLAGTTEAIITWPTENIKTQMQFKNQKLGFIQTSKNIYARGGYPEFFRGLTPVLAFNIPKVASRFYAFDIGKNALNNWGIKGNTATISAGLFAGFVESTLVTVPSETIKTQLIKNSHLKTMDVVKMEGIRGLYKGYVPTLGRQSLNQASRFLFYQHYKDAITKKNGEFSSMHSFLGGVGAGCFSVAVSTPMDVIKTQMQEGNKEGFSALFKDVYRTHGVKGYWRGGVARLLRVAPGQGVMFLTYEGVSKLLDKFNLTNK